MVTIPRMVTIQLQPFLPYLNLPFKNFDQMRCWSLKNSYRKGILLSNTITGHLPQAGHFEHKSCSVWLHMKHSWNTLDTFLKHLGTTSKYFWYKLSKREQSWHTLIETSMRYLWKTLEIPWNYIKTVLRPSSRLRGTYQKIVWNTLKTLLKHPGHFLIR